MDFGVFVVCISYLPRIKTISDLSLSGRAQVDYKSPYAQGKESENTPTCRGGGNWPGWRRTLCRSGWVAAL